MPELYKIFNTGTGRLVPACWM